MTIQARGIKMSNIKSRVKGIMNYKKPVFFAGIVVIAALVVTAVVLLSNPAKTTEVFSDKEGTDVAAMNTTEVSPETENIHTVVSSTMKELSLLPKPFELSQAKFNLGNKSMTLKLLMTKGTHVIDGEIGPYGTDYKLHESLWS